ncbi:MAG: hypothetical protein GOVbin4691_26 [Prokaryotic dsDNA virus sp.]|nr:MAG: hypothetical protein GOVbin4691_26 [Prokaryotic dsDNA virus sp.]
MRFKLIVFDNRNRVVLHEEIVEANELYGAAQIANKIFENLDILEKDITMELVKYDSKDD